MKLLKKLKFKKSVRNLNNSTLTFLGTPAIGIGKVHQKEAAYVVSHPFEM
jgi:hypothetical protein